jgi:hypothetical protein
MAFGMVLIGSGCASLPDKPALPPHEIWNRYVQSQGANTSVVYSARVKMWFRSMALVLYVEQEEQRLAIAALSPMGIKVFDAAGESNLVHKAVHIPQSRERLEAFAAAAWRDLKFLFQTPAPTLPNDGVNRHGRWSVEQSIDAQMRIRYEFDVFSGKLLQKDVFENRQHVCRIRFIEVGEQMVIEDYDLGFRLFLKPKSSSTNL